MPSRRLRILSYTPVMPDTLFVGSSPLPLLTVASTSTVPTLVLKNLFLFAGSTLNVAPDASVPANQAYGLLFSKGILNGDSTLNITNNGAGTKER